MSKEKIVRDKDINKLRRLNRANNCISIYSLQSIYFPLFKSLDDNISILAKNKRKIDLELKEFKKKHYLISKKIADVKKENINKKNELIKEYKKIKERNFKND